MRIDSFPAMAPKAKSLPKASNSIPAMDKAIADIKEARQAARDGLKKLRKDYKQDSEYKGVA